jgi:hypothetical protein
MSQYMKGEVALTKETRKVYESVRIALYEAKNSQIIRLSQSNPLPCWEHKDVPTLHKTNRETHIGSSKAE